MKKEDSNIESFLKNYKNMILGLDICSHIDKENNMNLLFSLNLAKENKSNNTFSSKRNRMVEKKSISIDMNDKNIDLKKIINKEIKRILKTHEGSKLIIYSKENSFENNIVKKIDNPLIISKQNISDYVGFKSLESFYESNEFELKRITDHFETNKQYVDLSIYTDKSLKMNYLKIDKYNSEEDLLNKENKLSSKESFFNCSIHFFKEKSFDFLLESIKNKDNVKYAIRTNFTEQNRNLFTKQDLTSLSNFLAENDSLNNFFGIIDSDFDSDQVGFEIKIIEETKRKGLERTDTSKYNVLYTDGSTVKDSKEKICLSAGAFLLDTEYVDSFKGVEVINTSESDEGEFMGAYLGVLEAVNNKLFDKPLSFILDSDNVADCIENSLKGINTNRINQSKKFRKMMKLIKENELEIKTFVIKSHSKFKDDIYLKNKEVDVMAINAIKRKLEEDSIPNNLKKRTMV
jgi:hypothetical protein